MQLLIELAKLASLRLVRRIYVYELNGRRCMGVTPPHGSRCIADVCGTEVIWL